MALHFVKILWLDVLNELAMCFGDVYSYYGFVEIRVRRLNYLIVLVGPVFQGF